MYVSLPVGFSRNRTVSAGDEGTAAFVTNGDVYKIQEAVHCAVPIVGIPLIAEQVVAVRETAAKGYGIELPLENVSKESVLEAINSLLSNKT